MELIEPQEGPATGRACKIQTTVVRKLPVVL